jgi:hypothetical protein
MVVCVCDVLACWRMAPCCPAKIPHCADLIYSLIILPNSAWATEKRKKCIVVDIFFFTVYYYNNNKTFPLF